MGKREIIIKTAMDLFVNQGFDHTPTSQISKKADIATGTLFYHFKTKEILINEIYKYVKKDLAKFMFKNVDDSQSTKQKIKSIWINFIEWGFINKLEDDFISKFYGSSYIDKTTLDEINSSFEIGCNIFNEALNENLLSTKNLELIQLITLNMYKSFLPEFHKVGKIDKNLLEFSFETYWRAISKK